MTRQPSEGEQRRKLVRVAATEDRQEAEAWFQTLKEAGIPARVAVRDNGAGGVPPRLLLYVLEEDRERAAAALAAAPAEAEAPPVAEAAPAPQPGPPEAPAATGDPLPAAAAPRTEEGPAPGTLTFATISGWLGLAFLVASVILIVLSMR